MVWSIGPKRKTKNQTGLDPLGPDRRLRLHAFKQRNWTDLDGFPRDTPRKCAHFEPILKRNGPEMDEMWPK